MANSWPPILTEGDGSPRALHQGDLVRQKKLPYLVMPACPLDPAEADLPRIGSDEVVTAEVEIEGDYMVVVSDDCDLLRDFETDDDKFVNLAPLVPGNGDALTEMIAVLDAQRGYEANASIFDVGKRLAERTLDIGRS